MTLGQRIQQHRKAKQLSQEALGEAMGVSRQAISKWESDATIPELDKLIALSRLFDIPVGQLLGTEEAPAVQPPEPKKDLTRRWLAGLTAVCVLLTCALGVLWHKYSKVEKLAAMTELADISYVLAEKAIFESLTCTLSKIEMGFPQAQGTEDLTITLSAKLVEPMEDWNIVSAWIGASGTDPWSDTWPRRTWSSEQTTDMKRQRDGSYEGSFTIENYSGEGAFIRLYLQEKDTGLRIDTMDCIRINPVISNDGRHTIEDVYAEYTQGLYDVAVPQYLLKLLPEPEQITLSITGKLGSP